MGRAEPCYRNLREMPFVKLQQYTLDCKVSTVMCYPCSIVNMDVCDWLVFLDMFRHRMTPAVVGNKNNNLPCYLQRRRFSCHSLMLLHYYRHVVRLHVAPLFNCSQTSKNVFTPQAYFFQKRKDGLKIRQTLAKWLKICPPCTRPQCKSLCLRTGLWVTLRWKRCKFSSA